MSSFSDEYDMTSLESVWVPTVDVLVLRHVDVCLVVVVEVLVCAEVVDIVV